MGESSVGVKCPTSRGAAMLKLSLIWQIPGYLSSRKSSKSSAALDKRMVTIGLHTNSEPIWNAQWSYWDIGHRDSTKKRIVFIFLILPIKFVFKYLFEIGLTKSVGKSTLKIYKVFRKQLSIIITWTCCVMILILLLLLKLILESLSNEPRDGNTIHIFFSVYIISIIFTFRHAFSFFC